tara:strand:- start:16457 stop:16885 length:429 start_codon:yes stop_codon:yes gene_type:complete
MKTTLMGVPPENIEDVWDKCEHFIELGNNKSQEEMTVEDIKEACSNAEMQLWIIYNEGLYCIGAFTTQILDYPNKKVCRIVTLGGKYMDKWLHLIEFIEDWAIEKGAKHVEMFCRAGFLKKLNKNGYNVIYTVLGKELTTLH